MRPTLRIYVLDAPFAPIAESAESHEIDALVGITQNFMAQWAKDCKVGSISARRAAFAELAAAQADPAAVPLIALLSATTGREPQDIMDVLTRRCGNPPTDRRQHIAA